MSINIRLILVDPIAELCDAWREAFGRFEAVSVVRGYFEDLGTYDCMVSAGNSFGLMDGGVDLAMGRKTHGSGVQKLSLASSNN